jgi:hypothetical protein
MKKFNIQRDAHVHLSPWVQFWQFLADLYAHHLPHCLFLVQNICATYTQHCAARLLHHMLDHLKRFASGVANFCQNLTFSFAQTAAFSISTTHRQLPFTTATFFFNTPHAHDYFFLGWEKIKQGTISWLHLNTLLHNSTTMRPFHTIIDCTTHSDVHIYIFILNI